MAALGLSRPAHADWRDLALRDYIRSRMSGRLAAAHVPSFSRQTGLACSACHYQFLTLTPLGRDFKLNGYTLTRQQLIVEKDKSKGKTLQLSPVPLVAAMLQGSLSHLKDALPDAQNGVTELPQQMSVFLAGELTSKIGFSPSSPTAERTVRSGSTTSISASPTRGSCTARRTSSTA